MAKETLTAKNLKNALWETLEDVKSGTMQPEKANAVATQAREILKTNSLQLKISALAGIPVPTEVQEFSAN